MFENVKISVIIPVYNSDIFLEKCLNSIINQTLKEIEIIIVNDGSKDDSLKIINNYINKDQRIILINKLKNEGVSSARNSALKIVKGEYIAFIDSDDYIEKEYLERMYLKAIKKNLDIVISNIKLDYLTTSELLIDLNIEENEILFGEEYLKRFFLYNGYGYLCNKLIKKSLFKKNNICFSIENSFMEDFEVICKLAFNTKRIGKLNQSYYHYIQHKNNNSRIMSIERLKSMIRVYNNLIIYYQYNSSLLELIHRTKNLTLISIFCKKVYDNSKEYENIVTNFIYSLNKENFIFKLQKNDIYNNYKRIFAFNFIKCFAYFFPKILIKILLSR